MKILAITAAAAALLLLYANVPPSDAQAQAPDGAVVAGRLSKPDARGFIKRQLPGQAPRLLLKDQRAGWYSTAGVVHVERARSCQRLDRSRVVCRYRLRLEADSAHAHDGWLPISCRGSLQVARLSDGGLGGDPGHYVCRTVKS